MSEEPKCYLFELAHSVVKEEDGLWYVRDREGHKWTRDQEWMRRYDDAQYDVIEITYDERNEKIVDRRRIPGFWSISEDELLSYELE